MVVRLHRNEGLVVLLFGIGILVHTCMANL